MPIDNHHKAHYGLAGLLAVGTIALGLNAGHTERSVSGVKANISHVASREWPEIPPEVIAGLVANLKMLPKHDITIYCTSGCGQMPEDLEGAFKSAGWNAHIEAALGSLTGVSVSPDTDEGRALSHAIAMSLTSGPVNVANQDGGAFTITIGRKGK